MERDEEGSVQRAFYAKSRESICSKELGPGAVFASVMPTVPACNGGVGWVIELAAHVADPKTCHTWPSRSDRLTGVNGIVFSGVVV
jgi:hypothetical protein